MPVRLDEARAVGGAMGRGAGMMIDEMFINALWQRSPYRPGQPNKPPKPPKHLADAFRRALATDCRYQSASRRCKTGWLRAGMRALYEHRREPMLALAAALEIGPVKAPKPVRGREPISITVKLAKEWDAAAAIKDLVRQARATHVLRCTAEVSTPSPVGV